MKETLFLFGNLRGVKRKFLHSVVKILIRAFQLKEFKNKEVQTLRLVKNKNDEHLPKKFFIFCAALCL